MWPNKNTAFIVIHGSGPHRPYVALDRFVRGFWNVLQDSNQGDDVRWRHRLRRRVDVYKLDETPVTGTAQILSTVFRRTLQRKASQGSVKANRQGWNESFISLAPQGKPALDFYEYYWDRYVDREITLKDAVKWLDRASAGAKRFYRERQELATRHEQSGSQLFKDGDFKSGGYLILFGLGGRALRWLQRLRITSIPLLGMLFTFLFNWVAELMRDLVVYTEADVRSRNYEIRQKVLEGAVDELRLLLEDERYEQVIVVAHSLGSVIAYETLNRVILDLNAEGGVSPAPASKIAGLVTFGSPLDKVAFFLREHTSDEEYVRRQILAHRRAFKRCKIFDTHDPVLIDNPIILCMDQARWLNFYHLQDPFSGHLDAYEVDRNILCDEKVSGYSEAHACYWTCEQMYQVIGDEFF